MLEYIKGEVVESLPSNIILDVGGIGYNLCVSLATYGDVNGKQEAKLFVYEAIREDAIQLFGFSTKHERDVFMLLISVSGVGANTARVILSSLNVEELQAAIASGNVNALKSVKGIGLKTAQRIIVDLKDKIGTANDVEFTLAAEVGNSVVQNETEQALIALGFPTPTVKKTVDKLVKDNPSATVAQLVKLGLKMM